jgi:N-methylhydantoinase A
VLFCYGGGGPLHASALARELSIPIVVIPPEPGNFSAVGMLLADARLDLSKTFTGVLDDQTIGSLQALFAAMEGEARGALQRDFGAGEVVFERFGEMRYVGQRHNIKVPISGLERPAAIREAFDRDYKRRYGHADARAAAEFQALHLSAFTRLQRPALERLPRARAGDGVAAKRPVAFGATGTLDAQVFERTALPPGFTGSGPTLIEEYGSTTLIWPGDRFEIGALGEIRIECGKGTK